MDEREQHAIDLLKLKWQQAEFHFKQKESFTNEREKIDQLIEQTIKKVESSELSAHCSLATNPAKAKQLLHEAETQKFILKKLNDKKLEIDKVLDKSEEITPQSLEDLKKELAHKIITLNPNKKNYYDNLIAQRNEYLITEKESGEVGKILLQLEQLIQTALVHRAIIKRQGMLSYIFGVNPNIAITKNLHAAELVIRSHLPSLKTIHSGEPLLWEIGRFLEEIAPHCTQRWGFSKLDQYFFQVRQQLLDFSEKIKEVHDYTRDMITKKESELNIWLSKN